MWEAGRLAQSWKPYRAAMVVFLGHFLMDDAAAGSHPLHVARGDNALVAHTVTVFDFSGQNIGDSFNPPVGMPGKSFEVIGRMVAAKIVQEEKRVELGHLVIAEGPVEVDARLLP